jgi:hypothetical protein
MESADYNDVGKLNCSFIQFVSKIMINVHSILRENLKVN